MQSKIFFFALLAATLCAPAEAGVCPLPPQKNYCPDDRLIYSDAEAKACLDYVQTAVLSRDDQITDWTNLGYIYNRRHEYEKGIDAANKALEIDPSYFRAYVGRGVSYTWLGKFDLALADVNKAIALAPTEPMVFEARGMLYLKNGKYQEARDDFTSELALDPTNFYALENRSDAEMKLRDPAAAIADLSVEIAIKPDAAYAYYERAKAYDMAGKPELAERDYASVQTAEPTPFMAGVAKGELQLRHKDYAGAVASYTQAIQADPHSDFAFYKRALAYQQLGEHSKELDDLNAVLRLVPDQPGVLHIRALLYLEMGDYQRALADSDEIVSRLPNAGWTLNAACWARAAADTDLDKALSYCRQAVKLQPTNARYLDSLAFVEFRRGNLEAALTDYTAAIAADPKQAISLYMRGYIEKKTGDAAHGDADIAAAIAIEPDIAGKLAKEGVKLGGKAASEKHTPRPARSHATKTSQTAAKDTGSPRKH